jgi:uncharacterized protein DUF6916
MGALPQHADFVPQLNTKFGVKLDETNAVDLVLTEVGELKTSARQEQFSIVFRGPLEVFLGQGLRELKHDEMGDFALFLVPIKQDENGFYYESVFNRLRK